MSNEELEASLRTYNRRRPFRPYLLEFVSGIQVRIENRGRRGKGEEEKGTS